MTDLVHDDGTCGEPGGDRRSDAGPRTGDQGDPSAEASGPPVTAFVIHGDHRSLTLLN
jgi:hypothetical protein